MIRMASVLMLCGALLVAAHAGTTGKIMGRVLDADTGEPLPYANVMVRGTQLGAAAGEAGDYFIINVPVGEYVLAASMMGYYDLEVKGVWVSADLTTHIDLTLGQQVLETGQVVEVTVERPMVDRGITASTKIVDGTAIESMPVSDFTQVMANQAGVVQTGGQRSGGMHVRGGRSTEIVFVVDGVNTTDPVTMTRGITIDNNAIAEMTVVAGGFNAEYGEAMSGVVNIVTKEGGDRLHGGVEYYTDDILGSRYDYGTNDVNFNLGGPIPLFGTQGSFFASGASRNTDNRAPGILPKPNNDRHQNSGAAKLRLSLAPTMKLVLSGNVAETTQHFYSHQRARGNWMKDQIFQNNGNTQLGATLTHSVGASTFYTVNVAHFNTYTKFSAQDGAHYTDFKVIGRGLPWVGEALDSLRYEDGGWAWYDIENQRWYGDDGTGNQITEEEVWIRYYERQRDSSGNPWLTRDEEGNLIWGSLAYQREAMNRRWFDTGHWDYDDSDNPTRVVYTPFDADAYLAEVEADPLHRSGLYRGDIDDWYRADRDEFRHFYYDFAPWWHHRNTTHYSADFAVVHQLGRYNQLKTGAFLRKSTLELKDLQFYNDNPYTDHYELKPTNAAAYLQDKIEYEDLTLNAGIRWDYFNPAARHFVDMENLDYGTQDADAKHQWSPRVGLSFAVSDRSILYASYGHFFQPVELGELYQGLNADVTSGLPLLGNPDLPAQKTVAYEVGIRHSFIPNVAGEVTAYYKDVENLLATREIIATLQDNPVNYTIFLIEDFAVVKGVDMSLTKRASENLSGTVSYSYLDAKGSGSSAREFYYLFQNTETPLVRREYPLEFDITHTFRTNLNILLPQDFGPRILGQRPLADLNANVQFNVASGAPYTPTDSRGNPGVVGSRRLPSTTRTDLRVDRNIRFGGVQFGLFADIRNLFDTENVADVYPRTGRPDDNGTPPLREAYATEEQYLGALENWGAYCKDPNNYGAPRTMTIGATLRF
ncbi:TonB-dependent receptor [Candidatus Fermentibacteria bacterium]|nr:TonB-dependent receptor [Candidatus Fermentibacteria bacterium]